MKTLFWIMSSDAADQKTFWSEVRYRCRTNRGSCCCCEIHKQLSDTRGQLSGGPDICCSSLQHLDVPLRSHGPLSLPAAAPAGRIVIFRERSFRGLDLTLKNRTLGSVLRAARGRSQYQTGNSIWFCSDGASDQQGTLGKYLFPLIIWLLLNLKRQLYQNKNTSNVLVSITLLDCFNGN